MKQKYIYILLSLSIGYYFYFRVQSSKDLVTLNDKIDNYEYLIQYKTNSKEYLKPTINEIINKVNIALKKDFKGSDTYILNHNKSCTPYICDYPYLLKVLNSCKELFYYTNGYLDPTLEPYIEKINESRINKTKMTYKEIYDSCKSYIGSEYLMVNPKRIKKLKKDVKVNVDNFIASVAVQEIAKYLKSKNIDNFYIQLNDEVCVNGIHSSRKKRYFSLKKHWNINYQIPYEIKMKNTSNFDNSYTYIKKITIPKIMNDPVNFDEYVNQPGYSRIYNPSKQAYIYVDINNANNQNILKKIENIEVSFKIKNKSLSIINNTQKNLISNCFYKDDLELIENYEQEEQVFIKRLKFRFFNEQVLDFYDYQNNFIKTLDNNEKQFVELLIKKSDKTRFVSCTHKDNKNKTFDKEINDILCDIVHKRKYLNTSFYDFQNIVVKNLDSKEQEIIKLLEINIKNNYDKEKIENNIQNVNDILFDIVSKKKYLNFYDYYKKKTIKKNKKTEMNLKILSNFDNDKMILINPKNGELIQLKFIVAYIISDDQIYSRAYTSAFSNMNFENINNVISKMNNHKCQYFVLYYNEGQNTFNYKASLDLNIDKRGNSYVISMK